MSRDGKPGQLYLVSTPIGNLEDITLRAVSVLAAADIIAAEDTRRARILCCKFDIAAKLIAYHAHNEHRITASLLDQVDAGLAVAVLSDAGTPAIADPGFLIVREARRRGIEPTVVPGVSALTFAAVASGLPVDTFAFLGFPPVKQGRRRTFLQQAAAMDTTVFLYEAPHRIHRLLEEIRDIMGEGTPVALVREATKVHEECLMAAVGELLSEFGERKWKGEFVVGINAREVTGVEHSSSGDRRTRRGKSPARFPAPCAHC